MGIGSGFRGILNKLTGKPSSGELVQRVLDATPAPRIEDTAWIDPAAADAHQRNMSNPDYAKAIAQFETLTAVSDDELRGHPTAGTSRSQRTR